MMACWYPVIGSPRAPQLPVIAASTPWGLPLPPSGPYPDGSEERCLSCHVRATRVGSSGLGGRAQRSQSCRLDLRSRALVALRALHREESDESVNMFGK